jgi:hypothetical protein
MKTVSVEWCFSDPDGECGLGEDLIIVASLIFDCEQNTADLKEVLFRDVVSEDTDESIYSWCQKELCKLEVTSWRAMHDFVIRRCREMMYVLEPIALAALPVHYSDEE